ncbi:hypothetical protein Pmani_004031 [Petrolisthes manimaculis]|uniref:Uncharacterized protein n=1 Tax=Petrolisthes manimaculis TaxID=1843537 RepID=A0AAE1QEV7_9EUCA|nr:hypothetical protein Pmani_004031 [Petrolisthes manimaculis]
MVRSALTPVLVGVRSLPARLPSVCVSPCLLPHRLPLASLPASSLTAYHSGRSFPPPSQPTLASFPSLLPIPLVSFPASSLTSLPIPFVSLPASSLTSLLLSYFSLPQPSPTYSFRSPHTRCLPSVCLWLYLLPLSLA